MTRSMPLHRVAVDSIEMLEVDAWRTELLARAALGSRPLTLYGRRDGDLVIVTAALIAAGSIEVLRTTVDPAVGYHELTSQLPGLHCFERELHEQHGVRIAGHPWLKPIRFEGHSGSMDAYPFYRVDGKEVHEVAVGPIHASVIEPGSFRFTCFGEHVLNLEIHLGYQHRGVEGRLLERDPQRLGPWVETIAGDTSVANGWAYCAAVESLAAVELDPEIELARGFALELERIAMHLSGLAGMAGDIGFLPGASTYGRLRTTAINTSMRLCGSRFGRGAVRLGGSGIDLEPALVTVVRDNLALLRADLAVIDECFLAARSVKHRLSGVGVVSEDTARQLGLVGPIARTCGIELDTRIGGRGIYATYPIATRIETTGDCWARARLRIAEIGASLDWLDAVIADPRPWSRSRIGAMSLAPSQLVISIIEGWRGEVVHCLETDATGALVHYKVQDPSLRNWMGLAMAVRGNEISDFPICNKSFDLSYCGNDL